jgi:hypothetical protein
MWAKFQVKIQNYSCATKGGCYRETHEKLDISLGIRQKPELSFIIDTAHYELQDARNRDWQLFLLLGKFPRTCSQYLSNTEIVRSSFTVYP